MTTRFFPEDVMKPVNVKIIPRPDIRADAVSVQPIWSGVDRPNTGGWIIAKKNVARLEAAIRSGAACPNPIIKKDSGGKTYVSYDSVIGKYTNADLKKIGY